MVSSSIFKVLMFLTVASTIDCDNVNILSNNMNTDVIINLLSSLVEKVSSIGAHVYNCKTLPFFNVPGLKFVDDLLKSWMCNDSEKEAIKNSANYIKRLLQLLKYTGNASNETDQSADQSSLNQPDQSTNQVCPNSDYKWETPAMFVSYLDAGKHYIAVFDLIDNKYVMRTKSIGLFFKELFAMATNSAGNQLYLLDNNNLIVITKKPCGDAFQPTYTDDSSPLAITLDPSQEYLLVTFAESKTMSFKLQPNGTIANTGIVVTPSVYTDAGSVLSESSFLIENRNIAVVQDEGLDRIYMYKFDDVTGFLSNTGVTEKLPTGGHTNFLFTSNGKFMYMFSDDIQLYRVEYDGDRMITAFSDLGEAEVKDKEDLCDSITVTKPLLHPNGRYMYVIYYDCNSVHVYEVDSDQGILSFIQKQEYKVDGVDDYRYATITADGTRILLIDGNMLKCLVIGSDGKLAPISTIISELKVSRIALTDNIN